MSHDKYVGRDIGRLTNLYRFCDKYHLSKETGNLEDITQDALLTMTLRNEFKRPAEEDNYKKFRITFNCHVIAIGYFTPEEIEDIKHLNHVGVLSLI